MKEKITFNTYNGVIRVRNDQSDTTYIIEKSSASQTIGDILGDKLKEIFNKLDNNVKKDREDLVVLFYKKFIEVNKDNFVCIIPFRKWFSFVKTAYDLMPIEEKPILFFIKGFGVSMAIDDIYRLFEKRVISLYGVEKAEQLKKEIVNSKSTNYESFVSLRLKSSNPESNNGERLVDHPFLQKRGRDSFIEIDIRLNPIVNLKLSR
jgi:hypothetical protein